MKLRNKKTGEIIESACIGVFKHKSSGDCERVDTEARSLEKVLEVWEDYKPKEPLIKDEKIRKAVRAWAEANNFLGEIEALSLTTGTRFSIGHYDIEFLGYFIYGLEANKTYTLGELCGEEEEV